MEVKERLVVMTLSGELAATFRKSLVGSSTR